MRDDDVEDLTQGEQGEPAPATEPGATTKPRRWSTTTKVISAIVAVVGAATGVFSVVQSLTRNSSSLTSLSISATTIDVGEIEFALPLAMFGSDGFPEDVPVCGAEQVTWLENHAVELHRRVRLDMRNFAAEGAMLALVDFRGTLIAAGAGPEAPPTHILVRCPLAPTVSVPRAALLRVDVSEDTARYRALPTSETAAPLPDVAVSWNLAPGESGTIDVKLTSQRSAVGTLLVTLLSGRDRSNVPIEDSGFDLPGLWRHGDVFLTVDAVGLECRMETPRGIEACGEPDISALLEAQAVPPAAANSAHR